jgi:hypothetical protein
MEKNQTLEVRLDEKGRYLRMGLLAISWKTRCRWCVHIIQ